MSFVRGRHRVRVCALVYLLCSVKSIEDFCKLFVNSIKDSIDFYKLNHELLKLNKALL